MSRALPQDSAEARELIEADLAAFHAAGRKIERIPRGVSANPPVTRALTVAARRRLRRGAEPPRLDGSLERQRR